MIRSFITISTACLALAIGLDAASITYTTPGGSTDTAGDPVSASALFTSSNGTLTIALNNLQPNIKAAGQLLTDLEFTLNVGGTSALLQSSATTVFVNGDGSTSPGSTGSAGWGFGTNGGHLIVCAICGNSTLSTPVSDAPTRGIIGPGPYTNANPSIAGNGPHNPFIDEQAIFTIHDASINSDTLVTSATFSFGTAFGDDVPGQGSSNTPEPITCALTGAGL